MSRIESPQVRYWLAVFVASGATLLGSVKASAAIPTTERDALIALYNSTNGPSWVSKTNWLGAPGTECTWFGVRCDGSVVGVSDLELNWNQLSGAIPKELASLTNMKHLFLGANNLSGSIPPELSLLTNLRVLELSQNPLTGTIPAEFGNLTNLVQLYLRTTQLSGPIPPELGRLTNLEYLFLNSNQLSGSIPTQLGSLAKLQLLDLSENQLSGPIPKELAALPNLDSLDLASNQLDGSIPAELGSLPRLNALYLSSNQLTGLIPVQLSTLTTLRLLDLSGNELSGSIPAELGSLTSLATLRLHSNQLSGSIPAELASLTNLGWLDLSSNQLTGSIPAWPIGLRWLYHLALRSNQLSGSIPSELGSRTNLDHLDLSSNQLSGSIPPGLGLLTRLEYLDLSSNQLSGTIPPSLVNLKWLEQLSLRSNQLSGRIPDEFPRLTSLASGGLDLRWNSLFAVDTGLVAFLNSKQSGGNWLSTQTIAPTGPFAGRMGPTTASVFWTPIAYSSDTGGYRVFVSTTLGGAYTLATSTADKSTAGATLSGLTADTAYYFVVDTLTDPHANNQNTLISEQTTPAPIGPTLLAPTISGFDPTIGPASTPVEITGTNFAGATQIRFNGTNAVTFTVNSTTQITASVPAAATTGKISVTTPGGTATSTDDFTVIPGMSFYTIVPCRLVDTRNADGALGGPALAAGVFRVFGLADQCGIPAVAQALSVNVTVTGATVPGSLRLYPAGLPLPMSATINYGASQTRGNNAVATLDSSGGLAVYCSQASGTVQLILDVNGYFAP